MKKITFFLPVLFLISCHSTIKKEDIKKLNGYWEIKTVTLPNGENKEYKVNETIDYFEVKNDEGFRQKVMPQFDGTFKTNDIKATFKIIGKDDATFIEYKTTYNWKDEIISIKDSALVLKSDEKVIYTYKKFKPFSFK